MKKNQQAKKKDCTSKPDSANSLTIKGRHEVTSALKSNDKIDFICMSRSFKGNQSVQIRELAAVNGVLIKELPPDLFENKYGAGTQGVVAITDGFSYSSLEALLQNANDKNQIIIALNRVEDPRNLGAIVRTAEASGCAGVIIPQRRSASMTEWAVKTAQGASSFIPIVRVVNLADVLEKLKEAGFWIVGLDGAASKSYTEQLYDSPTVIVAGGEDAGLGERIKKTCDDLVSIPLFGQTPSLNVSVSVGIAIFEAIRQKSVKT